MKISAKVGQSVHEVVVERQNGLFRVRVDDVVREVDAHKLEGRRIRVATT